MKRLLAFLLLASPLLGQPLVDSTQIKTKTNGGIGADTTNAVAAAVYRNSSAPGTPVTGQLWCDTSVSPCILKQYDGAAWTAPIVTPKVTTQTDISSFPGSPVDGQVFVSKSPFTMWVYDSTATAWWPLAHNFDVLPASANVVDDYSATVITAPASAPTAATSATAGSTGSGAYAYKVTFYNATGGETTAGPASNSVTPGLNKSNDLSSIPTGGTGTVGRRIYRTLNNGNQTYGPYYWVGTVADNSTTTYHDGLADSGAKIIAPEVNFSGALPSGWTAIDNSGLASSGGCGSTGSPRLSMMCMTSSGTITGTNTQTGGQGNSSTTADIAVRGSRDMSAYVNLPWTLTFRIKHIGVNGDTNVQVTNPSLFGMRRGTLDTERFWRIDAGAGGGSCGTTNVTLPWTSSNRPALFYLNRTAINGAITCGGNGNPWPQAEAEPLYFKLTQRLLFPGGGGSMIPLIAAYVSADGVTWTNMGLGTGANNANPQNAYNTALYPLTHFEINPWSYPGAQAQALIEVDQWTLTIP